MKLQKRKLQETRMIFFDKRNFEKGLSSKTLENEKAYQTFLSNGKALKPYQNVKDPLFLLINSASLSF